MNYVEIKCNEKAELDIHKFRFKEKVIKKIEKSNEMNSKEK